MSAERDDTRRTIASALRRLSPENSPTAFGQNRILSRRLQRSKTGSKGDIQTDPPPAKRPVMTMDGCVGIPARNKGWREQDFTGQVPERWWAQGAPGSVWPFRDAATIYSQDVIHRLIEIGSRGRPAGNYVMPQPGDVYAPGLAEVWWEPNDIHTPILLQRLLRGELRAFGDPGKAGVWPEWIAPRAWRDLKRDPSNEERFVGGDSIYWHVHVLPAELVASDSAASAPFANPPATAADAPEQRELAGALTGNLPKGDRWSAFDTLSWITFGEVRKATADFEFPRQEWSRDWERWPPEWLSCAFQELETGIPWTPDPDAIGPFGPDGQRAWARRIVANTGESAGQLLKALTADIGCYYANQDAWGKAKADLNEAMRRGQLRVWGGKAYAPSKPDPDGVPELLNPLLFTDTRGVNEASWIDWTPDGMGFIDYNGRSYDRVFFDSAKVRALWQALGSTPKVAPTPNAAKVKRGRRGFSYAVEDAPLVALARAGLAEGKYRNATDAARALAKDAKGGGNEESRMKRLLGRIQPYSAAEQD